MPGLITHNAPALGKADVYFEIKIPLRTDGYPRYSIKEAALAKIDYLVPRGIRKKWLGREYTAGHDPVKIKDFLIKLLLEYGLSPQNANVSDNFYCWTGTERICYHPFEVLKNGSLEQVSVPDGEGGCLVCPLWIMLSYSEGFTAHADHEQDVEVQT